MQFNFLWTLKHTKLNLAGTPRFVNILKIIILDLQKKTLHIKTKHSEIKLLLTVLPFTHKNYAD